MLVQQSDRRQRNAKVARALEVIAREHAESTRVLLHGFMNRVFRTEVRDAQVLWQLRLSRIPRVRCEGLRAVRERIREDKSKAWLEARSCEG